MADKSSKSIKRTLIDKANGRVVTMVSVAAFILVFSAVATKTLVSQANYQNRVIGAKRVAVNQLKQDIQSTSALKNQYNVFVDKTQNILGGDPKGSGSNDGNNADIILDALPSNYDFPALTTSLETLLSSQNLGGHSVSISSISGTDDEVAQSGNQISSTPSPVAMPFSLTVHGDYDSIQSVINTFNLSIRPIQIQTLDFTGNQSNLTLTMNAQTFYQPAKSLNITKQVVR